MFDLEINMRAWKDRLRLRGNFLEPDITELESHLREEIDDLIRAGLSEDEAFLIGVKRMGNVDSISQEYSKVNTENIWKQLLVDPASPEAGKQNLRQIILVIFLALLAGTLAKIPELFGIHMFSEDHLGLLFYFKNLSLFVFPLIAFYFIKKHNFNFKTTVSAAVIFAGSALIINLFPLIEPYDTVILSGIHLPIFLWLVVGYVYLATEWKSVVKRMDFIRLTGETFIYTVLILCGGVALVGFTLVIFSAIKLDINAFIRQWVIVFGGLAASVVAVYLVEAKKSIVENLAPVLAKIFSPLFLLTMLAFLMVMLLLKKSPYVEREFLIGFDLMLVLVLGLVLYEISARDIYEKAGFFDYLNLALILVALVIDAIALSAILFRLSAYGISPNKVAALGENLVLLVNLAGLAILYIRYFIRQVSFEKLEKWQTSYFWIYAGWTAIVAFVFPVVFGFK